MHKKCNLYADLPWCSGFDGGPPCRRSRVRGRPPAPLISPYFRVFPTRVGWGRLTKHSSPGVIRAVPPSMWPQGRKTSISRSNVAMISRRSNAKLSYSHQLFLFTDSSSTLQNNLRIGNISRPCPPYVAPPLPSFPYIWNRSTNFMNKTFPQVGSGTRVFYPTSMAVRVICLSLRAMADW